MSRSSATHNPFSTHASSIRGLAHLLLQKQTLETKLSAMDELFVSEYPGRSVSSRKVGSRRGPALGDLHILDPPKFMNWDGLERPPHHVVHQPSPAWIWAPMPPNSPTESVRRSYLATSGEATSQVPVQASGPTSPTPTESLSKPTHRFQASLEAAPIILAAGRQPPFPATRARARFGSVNSNYILRKASRQSQIPSPAKHVAASSSPQIKSYPSFKHSQPSFPVPLAQRQIHRYGPCPMVDHQLRLYLLQSAVVVLTANFWLRSITGFLPSSGNRLGQRCP